MRPRAHASRLVPPLEALSGCGSVYSNRGPGSLCDHAREADRCPPQNPPSPATPSHQQPRRATSTATAQARSTPRRQEAKGRKTETSRLAESRCQRSGGSRCSGRSPTPTSSSTWMSSCSTRSARRVQGHEAHTVGVCTGSGGMRHAWVGCVHGLRSGPPRLSPFSRVF